MRMPGNSTFGSDLLVLCVVVSLAIVASDVPHVERAALMELYTSLGGSNWRSKTNWNVNDPCTNAWSNVNCDAANTTVT